MTETFAIRRGTSADSDVLRALFRRSVRGIAARDYPKTQIEIWAGLPLDPPGAGGRVVFVAEQDSRAIGFAQYEPPHHIDMLYVDPEYLRKGVATALLAAVENEAARRNIRALYVEASVTSRPFFKAQGYVVLTPQIEQVRGEGFLNYRMTKRLG